MSTKDSIMDSVRRITGIETINLEDNLVNDLNVDSMSFVKLVVDIEGNTEMVFKDEDLLMELFPTVKALIDYFE